MIGPTPIQRRILKGLSHPDPVQRSYYERPTLRSLRRTYASLERKGLVLMVAGRYVPTERGRDA